MKLSWECPAGMSVDDACEHAQRWADATQCEIHFDFNGVHCIAKIGGRAHVLAQRQAREQARVPTVSSALGDYE